MDLTLDQVISRTDTSSDRDGMVGGSRSLFGGIKYIVELRSVNNVTSNSDVVS